MKTTEIAGGPPRGTRRALPKMLTLKQASAEYLPPMEANKTGTPRKRRGPPKLLTLQQASAEYGPPYTSLRDLVLEGYLKRVQLGDSARIWVRRDDLERLIGG
jgi:hypothetical protein